MIIHRRQTKIKINNFELEISSFKYDRCIRWFPIPKGIRYEKNPIFEIVKTFENTNNNICIIIFNCPIFFLLKINEPTTKENPYIPIYVNNIIPIILKFIPIRELLPLVEVGASWEVCAFVSHIYLPSSSGSPYPDIFF